MHQYEFQATHRKRGHVDQIRATARNERIALWHVLNYYGSTFAISPSPVAVRPAHAIHGEIDCTGAGAEQITTTTGV